MKGIEHVLPANIQRKRRDSGLTQMKLAEKANIGLTYVAQIEQGKKLPTLKTLEGIARALGTSMDTLVVDVESERSLDKDLAEVAKKLKGDDRRLLVNIAKAFLKK